MLDKTIHMFPLLAGSLLCICLTFPVHADGDPEAQALAYFTAVQEEGLPAAARFMHPDALAEFKALMMPLYRAENTAGGRELLNMTFSSETSYAQLQAMDPQRFMNEFMDMLAEQSGRMPIQLDNVEVVGTVSEGEMRHVLTRTTIGSGELAITQYEVMNFLPYGDTWLLQLDGDLRMLAATLRSNLQGALPPTPLKND